MVSKHPKVGVNMSVFSSILKKLRQEKGYTQDELAALLNVSRSRIGMYETGSREPDFDTLRSIADLFGVDIGRLLGYSSPSSPSTPIPSGCQPLPDLADVPLVGRIACGDPITAEENIEGAVGVPAIWHADFALVCVGDSMAPSIRDGDLVAIRIQPEVETGEIAAVRIDGEATLKRVYTHPDCIELRPENPAYRSIILTGEEMNEVHIEGKAVGLCRGL